MLLIWWYLSYQVAPHQVGGSQSETEKQGAPSLPVSLSLPIPFVIYCSLNTTLAGPQRHTTCSRGLLLPAVCRMTLDKSPLSVPHLPQLGACPPRNKTQIDQKTSWKFEESRRGEAGGETVMTLCPQKAPRFQKIGGCPFPFAPSGGLQGVAVTHPPTRGTWKPGGTAPSSSDSGPATHLQTLVSPLQQSAWVAPSVKKNRNSTCPTGWWRGFVD